MKWLLALVIWLVFLSCSNTPRNNISNQAFADLVNKTQASLHKSFPLLLEDQSNASKFLLVTAQKEFCQSKINTENLKATTLELYDTSGGVYVQMVRVEFYYSPQQANVKEAFNKIATGPLDCIDDTQFEVDLKLMPYKNLFILVNTLDPLLGQTRKTIDSVLSKVAEK